MKSQKVSHIGIVVADQVLRAAQRIDGRIVSSQVPLGDDMKRSMRKLLSSSPFSGRNIVVGLEGDSVLVESMVVPSRSSNAAEGLAAERLKGDPVFNDETSVLGVSVAPATGRGEQSMVILAAVNRERIAAVMAACREQALTVQGVETAALASWRAWSGTGNQLRLVRGERQDIILAGVDSKLMFCRVVEGPMSAAELRATITRASSLFSGSFDSLSVSGSFGPEMQAMAQGLGLAVETTMADMDDPQALGLAMEGAVLAEFTPPEERELRTRRQVRKTRMVMIAAAAAAAVVVGVLGFQRISVLKADKLSVETRLRVESESRTELAKLDQQLRGSQALAAEVTRGQPGHAMSRLFSLVLNAAPEDVMLESTVVDDVEDAPVVVQTKKRGRRGSEEEKPVGPVPRSLVVRLGGLAGSDVAVSRFAADLFASEAFADVRIETSERTLLDNGMEGERFRIYARAETR